MLASLRRLAATLIEIVQTRLEIVATELEEERARLRDVVVYGLLTLFFAGFGFLLVTAYVLILFWDTYRLSVVGAFALFYCGAASITGFVLWRRIRTRPRLFSATLAEFARDRNQLKGPDA